MIEHNDDLTILAEGEEYYIGICTCCNVINLVYRNIAIKLSEEQFEYFKNYLNELQEEYYSLKSRTGKSIFMSSSNPNIVFCFSIKELHELRKLLNESSLMLEINKIFKS